MLEVTIEEAMENLEVLIDKACLNNYSFIITKNGFPFMKVEPLKKDSTKDEYGAEDILNSWRKTIWPSVFKINRKNNYVIKNKETKPVGFKLFI